MAAIIFFLALLSVCGSEDKEILSVAKCCNKGEFFEFHEKHCLSITGQQKALTEWGKGKSSLNESELYWLPRDFQRTDMNILYDMFLESSDLVIAKEVNETAAQLLREGGDDEWILETFLDERQISKEFIGRYVVCMDASGVPEQPFVMVVSINMTSLPKCCGKYERLDSTLEKCETMPSVLKGNEREEKWEGRGEVLNTYKNLTSSLWLPKTIQTSFAPVTYGNLAKYPLEVRYLNGTLSKWNVAVNTDDESSWILLTHMILYREFIVNVLLTNNSWFTQRLAHKFCVDAAAPGALAERVLLAVVADMYKCCKKGQRFITAEGVCVDHSNYSVNEADIEELNSNISSWLPTNVRHNSSFVRYAFQPLTLFTAFLSPDVAEDMTVEYPAGEFPTLSFYLQTLQGKKVELRTASFCFEDVDEGPLAPRVLVANLDMAEGVKNVIKCCPRGYMLSSTGWSKTNAECEADEQVDWSPLNSSVTSLLDPKYVYVAVTGLHHVCTRYQIEESGLLRESHATKSMSSVMSYQTFSAKFYCSDVLMRDGSKREVLATCLLSPSVQLYEKARLLHVLAVVLLAAAVVAILAREDMRRSIYGKVLACHVVCLTVVSTLEAVWFLTHERDKECSYFAFSIYFFLLSGAYWLNAIAMITVKGFRRPPGELARGGEDKGLLRLALYSVYAWGFPATLTTVAVYVYQQKKEMQNRGFPVPTFFETRTCTFTTGISKDETDFIMASAFYYYLPVGLLLVVNAVCVLLTFCKTKQSNEESSPQYVAGPLRSVRLYVILLLTISVLELAIEGTLWTTRKQWSNPFLKKYNYYMTEINYVFAISGTCVDVVRASVVLWLAMGPCQEVCVTWLWNFLCMRTKKTSVSGSPISPSSLQPPMTAVANEVTHF